MATNSSNRAPIESDSLASKAALSAASLPIIHVPVRIASVRRIFVSMAVRTRAINPRPFPENLLLASGCMHPTKSPVHFGELGGLAESGPATTRAGGVALGQQLGQRLFGT